MKRRHFFRKEKQNEIVITCDECGKTFVPGNREDGLPNGAGFQTEDGKIYNVCCDCIIKKGAEANGR